MIDRIDKLKENYLRLTNNETETFSLLVNKLINVNYLTAQKEEDKNSYYFIISHLECFKNYFAIAGMELVHHQATKTLVLKSEYFKKLSLNKTNSIVILILRLLYQQKLHNTTLTHEILITTRELQEKYEHLNNDGIIKRGELEEALRLFKKHNLINYKGTDFLNDDFIIIIYPTITYAIGIEDIEKINQKISTYKGGSIEDEKVTAD